MGQVSFFQSLSGFPSSDTSLSLDFKSISFVKLIGFVVICVLFSFEDVGIWVGGTFGTAVILVEVIFIGFFGVNVNYLFLAPGEEGGDFFMHIVNLV